MRVVMYLRLSSEDRDVQEKGKTESDSIANQRLLLTDFVRTHPDLSGAELDELCDDGWSGKNFERPGMAELLEQVKRGELQCIVVKDECAIIGLNQKDLEKQGKSGLVLSFFDRKADAFQKSKIPAERSVAGRKAHHLLRMEVTVTDETGRIDL